MKSPFTPFSNTVKANRRTVIQRSAKIKTTVHRSSVQHYKHKRLGNKWRRNIEKFETVNRRHILFVGKLLGPRCGRGPVQLELSHLGVGPLQSTNVINRIPIFLGGGVIPPDHPRLPKQYRPHSASGPSTGRRAHWVLAAKYRQ